MDWKLQQKIEDEHTAQALEEAKYMTRCRRCGMRVKKFDCKCFDAGANEWFVCESCVMSSGDYDA